MTSSLAQKSVVVIFAYSPTGLGHLRVTNALYHGLPEAVTPILLGSQDKTVSALHRFISIHPFTRSIFEWGQQGFMQYVATYCYQKFLRARTKLIYQQLTTILDERLDIPETVVIVATHFGLAHQLAQIKEKIIRQKKVRVLLFVQVTDDSPQHIWYVVGSDLIFVPSQYTKQKLEQFQNQVHLAPVPLLVTPYPLSPFFAKQLSPEKHQNRLSQVDKESKTAIHIALPIPGAAVGTTFITKLITHLHLKSDRFVFHIIAKQAVYTASFLSTMAEIPYVKLHVSSHDRETVTNYEKLYEEYVIAMEITKPSEQTFKALLHPTQKGGSLLLFAHPVGRQEYDNIAFLRRHHLIPSKTVQKILWEKAEKQITLDNVFGREILRTAKTWRGLLLPYHSIHSANFISWCITQGFFSQMMHYTPQTHSQDTHIDELGDDGVHQFWQKVSEMVSKTSSLGE